MLELGERVWNLEDTCHQPQVNNGMTLTTFAPASPPTFPTPDKLFDGLVRTSSEYVMTAPAILEVRSRHEALQVTVC